MEVRRDQTVHMKAGQDNPPVSSFGAYNVPALNRAHHFTLVVSYPPAYCLYKVINEAIMLPEIQSTYHYMYYAMLFISFLLAEEVFIESITFRTCPHFMAVSLFNS